MVTYIFIRLFFKSIIYFYIFDIMKKLFILFILILNSCSSESTDTPHIEPKCYNILSRGFDERGHFIIINYSDFNQRRYSVSNYLDYLNTTKICEPINLTQQPL